MNLPIVDSQSPVVLVGGGPVPEAALAAALSTNPVIVAADGGAAHVVGMGARPDAVYGDMDSLDSGTRDALDAGRLHRVAEQDSTDFDKALRHIRAPLVLAYGFLGGRADHALAALTVLAGRADRRCILVGAEDVIALCPPRIALDLAPGTRVSLYPLAPVRGRSTGLRWPIDGLDFAPAGRVGTSNEATGPVHLAIDAPAMLLILPASSLTALQAGLDATPGGWPVRAG